MPMASLYNVFFPYFCEHRLYPPAHSVVKALNGPANGRGEAFPLVINLAGMHLYLDNLKCQPVDVHIFRISQFLLETHSSSTDGSCMILIVRIGQMVNFGCFGMVVGVSHTSCLRGCYVWSFRLVNLCSLGVLGQRIWHSSPVNDSRNLQIRKDGSSHKWERGQHKSLPSARKA